MKVPETGAATTPDQSLRKAAVTFQLAGVNFASSATNGLVVVALPRMTADLQLPESLAFWPSSVPGLATASALLLAGAFADVVGPKSMELVGCVASGAMIIGCGFTRRGEELVALRALQGVAMALHLSSSVALITSIMPRGKGRNLSFACVGLSQPLGFSVGLVMGGVLVDTIGWRAGWYLYGGINLLLSVVGAWALPASKALGTLKTAMRDMRTKVDGVGALLASAFMTLISYFLAYVTEFRSRHRLTIAAGSSAPTYTKSRSPQVSCFSAWVFWRFRSSSAGCIANIEPENLRSYPTPSGPTRALRQSAPPSPCPLRC